MAVHINEVHTDIRPAEGSSTESSAGAPEGGGRTVDDRWLESRGRTRWLEARTTAHGYED